MMDTQNAQNRALAAAWASGEGDDGGRDSSGGLLGTVSVATHTNQRPYFKHVYLISFGRSSLFFPYSAESNLQLLRRSQETPEQALKGGKFGRISPPLRRAQPRGNRIGAETGRPSEAC